MPQRQEGGGTAPTAELSGLSMPGLCLAAPQKKVVVLVVAAHMAGAHSEGCWGCVGWQQVCVTTWVVSPWASQGAIPGACFSSEGSFSAQGLWGEHDCSRQQGDGSPGLVTLMGAPCKAE